jgi:hypothetical protein
MKVRGISESTMALFQASKGLCGLFGDINILFQAANNLQVTREPDQLTHASGQYTVRKC